MTPLERAIARELRRFARAIIEAKTRPPTTRYIANELAQAARLSGKPKKP